MARFQDSVQRGTRASQPLATAVGVGTLYGVTDEGNIIERSNGTTWDAYSPASSISAVNSYLQYREQQAQNTQGGTFTSGAWRTRVLNTEVYDAGGYGTLASNQITLTAGTYRIYATAPAYLVARHQARLQNVTDAVTILIGTSMYCPSISGNTVQTNSIVAGVFTIGSSKALELQHQCQTTESTDGFGVAANFTTEVYSVVELWRLA